MGQEDVGPYGVLVFLLCQMPEFGGGFFLKKKLLLTYRKERSFETLLSDQCSAWTGGWGNMYIDPQCTWPGGVCTMEEEDHKPSRYFVFENRAD